MSDTNETSADIIAEMRDLGKLDEKSTDKIPRRLMGLGLRTYADRIEAALKREKSSIEADALAVGGMVEAARRGKAKFDAACDGASLNTVESRSGEEGARPKTAESSPGAKGWNTPRRENWRDEGGGGRADSKPGTQTAGCASDPAPSSPAPALSDAKRNCDRYRTLTEALSASGEMTAEAHGLCGMSNTQLVRFCKWLFCSAEATSNSTWRFVNKETNTITMPERKMHEREIVEENRGEVFG